MNIELEDLNKMRHALGICERTPRKRWGYRNHYSTNTDDPSMRRLTEAGLVWRGSVSAATEYGEYASFHVTEAGMRAVGLTAREIARIKADRW